MKGNPIQAVIIRACTDKDFRAAFIKDPKGTLASEGFEVPADIKLMVHEGTDDKITVVLPGPETTDWMSKREKLPVGKVADVPVGLTLEWSGQTLAGVGRIDMKTAGAVKREILKAFTDIDMDMSKITFISSAGLASLLVGQKHLAEHDAHLRLVNLSEEVRNVFDLSGFADVFEVVELTDMQMPPTVFYGPSF